MIVVKDTPLQIGWLAWPIAPPDWSLIVAVKATYAIPPEGGVCALAADQDLIDGDRYEDDDVARPMRYATDLAIGKPRAEVTLVGTAHAPRGRPVTSMVAGFRFGAIERELAVVGDRYWKKGLLGGMTDPAPFTAMPLSWERAFGGPDHAPNPLGRGLAPVQVDGQERVPLPNVENRTAMLKSSQARVEPACPGPLPPHWAPRASLAGTYDAIWHATRWPWFPKDLDWSYFNAAPPEQRIVGHWRGDEPLELIHLHPERPIVRARLPGIRPRCLMAVRRDADAAPSIEEVRLALDTVQIDADALTVHAVWRGNRRVSDERHPELEQVFVTQETRDAPLGHAELARAYHAELARRAAEEGEFEPEPMPRGPRG